MASPRANASSRLASMGMGAGGAEPTGEGKQTFAAVHYTAMSPDPRAACAGCDHFQGPDACELVAGLIDPRGTCDLFEPDKDGPGGVELPEPTETATPPMMSK